MADANRVRVSSVVESTLGTIPGSARMRTARITGESLRFTPETIDSNEMRSDRMTNDPVQVFQSAGGGINFEMSYPTDASSLSDVVRSAFYNDWTLTPFRDNDGTADSVITDVGTTTDTMVFTTGAAFAVGHLILNSGFTNAANNGLFRVTTGGTTSLVSSSSSWTAETAPPAAARTQVVGFQGASGDITATATGLGSTALNFTTLGLAVGQWIKIGGTGSTFRFTGTTACNDWCRITAITATALTLDNRPAGWGTDSGSSKTIRVFFGDRIINGTTRRSLTIEKAFLDQTTPTYIAMSGMVAGSLSLSFSSRQMITGSVDFSGTTAVQGTSAYGTTYSAATTESVMAANVNVGRIAEAGTTVTSPNHIRDFTIQMTNNLRVLDAVGQAQAIDIGAGEVGVTGQINTYFGDNTLYTKLLASTATSLNARATFGTRGMIVTLPRVKFTGGAPAASGKNTDVYLPLDYRAAIDSTTNSEISLDRFPYWES